MKKAILTTGIVIAASLFISVTPSSARDYPVCVQGLYRAGGEGDAIRCEYDNYEQCRAATLGVTGTCLANPLYVGDTRQNERRAARRRH